MAFSRIQVTSGTNTTFNSTVTTSAFGSNTTAGNILIAVGEADVVNQNGCTVTDNKGNTWNRVNSTALAATFNLEIWYSVITTGGSGHTVTMTDNGGGVDSLLIVEEWSGNAASPSDVSVGATGSSTALSSGATASTTQADELVIGAGVVNIAGIALAAGAGYSNLTTVATAFSILGFESKVVSSIGTQTAALTATSSAAWVCICATFKQESGNIVAWITA